MKKNFKLTAFKYGDTTLSEAAFIQGGNSNVFYDISLLYFLIQTPKNNILIDVGCDDMPGFVVTNFIKPYELLQKYGLNSEDITDVVITHAHHDHIQAVKYYSNSVIHIQDDEYDIGKEYIPSNFKVKTFKESAEIIEGLKVIKIGGHSKGSSVVIFENNNRKYVLVGDECYVRICFEKGIASGSVYSLKNNMDFIEKYRSSQYEKILFHDNKIISGKFGWTQI